MSSLEFFTKNVGNLIRYVKTNYCYYIVYTNEKQAEACIYDLQTESIIIAPLYPYEFDEKNVEVSSGKYVRLFWR